MTTKLLSPNAKPEYPQHEIGSVNSRSLRDLRALHVPTPLEHEQLASQKPEAAVRERSGSLSGPWESPAEAEGGNAALTVSLAGAYLCLASIGHWRG